MPPAVWRATHKPGSAKAPADSSALPDPKKT